MEDLKEFCNTIGYQFNNQSILIAALTHPSLIHTYTNTPLHYERLELLGDAVLGFIITNILFNKHPHYREGQLSQKVALLTSRDYCYKIGLKLNISSVLRISKGEEKNGGRTLYNNISNAVETILAAIYLDSGCIKECHNFVNKHWQEFLNADDKDYLEPKTTLQEWSQDHLKSLPQYKVIETTGPDHNRQFMIELELSNKHKITGQGKSKKLAEKDAAANMLKLIQQNHEPIKTKKAKPIKQKPTKTK